MTTGHEHSPANVRSSKLSRAVAALGWDPRAVKLSSLYGGITNENYRAEVNGEVFVLRLNGASGPALGIDRARELRCARIAAALGVGPEVVACKPGLLVTRFVEGLTLSAAACAQPAFLARIAAAIRRFHQGTRFPGAFSPFATVRRYHAAARRKGVRFPAALPEVLSRMKRIESALSAAKAGAVPCHNDLLASNLIDAGGAIRILDWEYAAMGDPFFDLGNFAVNQRLSQDRCRLLLKEYFGVLRPGDEARLNLQRLASDLREAFWGFLQAGISEIEFDFLDYGNKHLARFLREARGPFFERWLSNAVPGVKNSLPERVAR